MHLSSTGIILLLGLRFCVMGGEAEKKCDKNCDLFSEPICVKIKTSNENQMECTFPNDCFLEIYTCKAGKELEKKPGFCASSPYECYDIILNAVVPEEP
ncbi:hypothetical protein FF38_00245 [Lucilia cuprina]|uniref:Kazal-like domain-containing protein n=1 Tax=Lucilia cuprina TaxID=7375 RepID=A0A0L0CKP0_LUCCU|nr:hypothetical protein FF38_00245 [Lucilia cuprina]